MASFLAYNQILPQYHTYNFLENIDPNSQVALQGQRLEPEMEKRVLKALRESRWDPGNEAKGRRESWKRAPQLSITTDAVQVDIQVGIMNETPVLRRGKNEGLNSGIITSSGLWEPLTELGWTTKEGPYHTKEWGPPVLNTP
jgi:hypothetical protein